jgi:hypothetical protein
MRRLAVALALVWAGVVLAVPTTALARNPGADPAPAPPAPSATSLPDGITLHAPSVIKAGRLIEVEATLANGGLLRPGATLHFLIDDIERRLELTDGAGTAHFRLRGVLASGTHQLLVRYTGNSHYYWGVPASAAATFVVAPLIISVSTVPAMPGIMFTLDGRRAIPSDATGGAVLAVARAGIHTLAVSVPAPDQTTRITFTRWSDDSWKPSRTIRVVQDMSIAVGLRAAYLTPIQFVGLDGNPLDPSLVSDVVISGPNAEVLQLQYPYDPIWLQTPLPAKHSGEGGLHLTAAPYSLSFARYSRLSVASTGQYRFSPEPGKSWAIPLLLFTLHLGARDAIFGTTLGNPIKLTGPTGRAQIVTLDRQGKISLVLSRGNYQAQVMASGVTPIATIALSRSQVVILPVITPADLIVIALFVFVIAATVFVVGRGRLWAFGRASAVRIRYEDPIIRRWERSSPQRRAVQAAVVAMVGRLQRPAQPRPAPPTMDVAQATPEPDRPRDPQNLRILDGGAPGDNRLTTYFGAEAHGHPQQRASAAARVASTFPRSHMLAHEETLGQAIEVGMIINNLLSSGKAERFLLLVHKSVMQQWQLELKQKFGLRVPRFDDGAIYDHDNRELAWSGNPWSAFPILLASSHLARRRDRRPELLEAAPWDVVVVDEAHEAHRSGSKATGGPNKLLALLQTMKAAGAWKALYLASASRRQMHLHEAWDLMELLDLTDVPADVADDFAHYFTIPAVDRPDGDWEFLRQMSADYFGDAGAHRLVTPIDAVVRPSRAAKQQIRRSAANARGAMSNSSFEHAQEGIAQS